MSGSTTKKVVIDRFDRAAQRGFVNPSLYLLDEGVEIISLDGSVAVIPYEQVKAVSFVRDMEGDSIFGERREFRARPKTAGLWLEITVHGGDRIQGIVANDLLLFDSKGFAITPPEVAGNTQKVFIPRKSVERAEILGVIGSPLKRTRGARDAEKRQITLFEE